MRTFPVFFLIITLSGCATTVATKSDLFAASADRKECYSYDTQGRQMARNMPTAVGLGILGGLFPPLMIITALGAGASAAADQAALPSKCGLNFDDVVKEAWTVSFYEKARSIWIQKSGDAGVMASYLEGDNQCSNHELKMWRVDAGTRKDYVQKVQICRNEQGEPALKSST